MHTVIQHSQDTVKRLRFGHRLHNVIGHDNNQDPPSPGTTRTQTAEGFDALQEWRGHVDNFRKRYHAARERENPRRSPHHHPHGDDGDASSEEEASELGQDQDHYPHHAHHAHHAHHHHHTPVSFASRLDDAEHHATSPDRATNGGSKEPHAAAAAAAAAAHQPVHPYQQHPHHKKKRARAATSLEYAPGTGLLYGSKVCFQSCQKNFLRVNPTTAQCTTVAIKDNDLNMIEGNIPPSVASKIQILRASDPEDRSQICYGDTVWLNIDAHYRHGGKYGDAPEASVGGRFVGTKMNATPDTVGGGSSSSSVPIIQTKRSVRGTEIARWLVVNAKSGHTPTMKGTPVGHLDEIRLEMEFLCLASKSEPQKGGLPVDVNVLMLPAGGMAKEATKTRKMSETVERWDFGSTTKNKRMGRGRHNLVRHGGGGGGGIGGVAKGGAKGGASPNGGVRQSRRRGKKTTSSKKESLNAGWGTSWRVYLSELADDSSTSSGNNTNAASGTSTSIGGGGSSSAARKPKDRGNKVLLDAQSKLLQSRTKRRERGDSKWVRDLEQQRRDIEHESADLCALATEDRHSTQDSTKDVGEVLRQVHQVHQVRQVRQPGKDAREAFLASNSMARALKARYVVVASEGFSFKKRGEFWGNVKRKKQQRQQQGGEGGEGGERGEGRMVGMIFYATLRPNENWCVDTSLGHQWVAYDDDRVELGRWIASRSLPLVVFLPGKKGSRKEEEGERVSDV